MHRIRWWWRQPEHYDWITSYLTARRLATMTRAVVCTSTLVLAWIPVAMLFGSGPPVGPTARVLTGLTGFAGTAAALLWALRLPSRTQSIAYALICSASIVMATLAQSDPLFAILVCSSFAAISGYVALFHTAAVMTANLVVVLAASAVPAVAFAASSGVVRSACAYAVVVVLNVAVPFGIQIIVQALGIDLLRADRDPLTGLYNRRAFYRHTSDLVQARPGDCTLMVAMIDLDKFKQLNDTHGHAVGDLVLAAVGRTLRDHTRRDAIVGRAGGEEFLVADVFADATPEHFGARLRDAIAALPYRITASVGTATVRCDRLPRGDGVGRAIATLIDAADTAMYAAKRNGGNQARHHRARLDPNPAARDLRSWNAHGKRWEREGTVADGDDITTPLDVPPDHHVGARRRHHVGVRPDTPRKHHEHVLGHQWTPSGGAADRTRAGAGRHRAAPS